MMQVLSPNPALQPTSSLPLRGAKAAAELRCWAVNNEKGIWLRPVGSVLPRLGGNCCFASLRDFSRRGRGTYDWVNCYW